MRCNADAMPIQCRINAITTPCNMPIQCQFKRDLFHLFRSNAHTAGKLVTHDFQYDNTDERPL
eukprot:7272586-Lingulodinium_polyedra.AAC.1